ncbi:ribosome hibernation-promoting factor, HPF/YfiA family [Metabacillus litoralis]|uniref:ribosome hibernation-promoting factor, HPF/YfiA family n=1 Tax=Metabacillus litoralis TaxID=152268 RepID=UPI001CFCCE5A|nr:ribosome-associated translation inhibitor RaiA [Metabacillus litoralis]
MNLIIHSKNLQITDAIKNYVNQKIGSAVEHYFPEKATFHVYINLSIFKNNQCIEVTVPIGDLTIRAEEQTTDMYKSIDLVEEKLKRQFRKYKTRLNRKSRKEKMILPQHQPLENNTEQVDEEEEIVRMKQFQLKPMSEEEAILQMNLLDHQFFVFQNSENDLMSVVYKRKNGQYGLITSDVVEQANRAM